LEINAIRDDSGNVVNYTAMFTDITERRLTEANLELSARQVAEKNVLLNVALARANEANRAKSEFLANMSHELRTPLNAIIGFSEIMSQEMFGPLGNPQYLEYSQHIQDSGVHLLAVINDILDISKIEAGEVTLEDDDVDLSSLIDETVRLVSQRAERARQILDIRVEQGLPHLRGDARRVKQALLNIISNAVKFTPDGGRIAVDARCAHDGGLLVAVEDTGIGIAKDDIAKALAPFGQVDSRLQRKYEGTGLGLAITKHFVEMHEGVLSLESEVGVGTVVTVHFPPSRALDSRPVAVD
ncbi:MAG: hypothetical protein K2Q10_09170, partial [Rhodospirillales bacterium]|nr:hypothetical protein [Rhodospirillales bacterium]